MPKGTLMVATFEIDGQEMMALNGGPSFTFTQGFSLFVECQTQAEVDTYWEKLTADGGEPGPCGWLTDKFGVSWQIVPAGFIKLVTDKDTVKAGRAMQAMMKMTKLDLAALKRAFEG
jgi:two-component system sensor histidine kinase QseC